VLGNGLGRYEAARDAAWRAFESDQFGHGLFVVPERAEAAARIGDATAVRPPWRGLSERTRAAPTERVLGIEARVRAGSARLRSPTVCTASRSSGGSGPGSGPATACPTRRSPRLFPSPRTVQYDLGKVFAKLDISSRDRLAKLDPSLADPADVTLFSLSRLSLRPRL
jgi:hypothetical protein